MNSSNHHYYEWESVAYDYETITEFPISSEIGLSQYLPLLPVKKLAVSFVMGEGKTPLASLANFGKSLGLSHLFAKREDYNPTGCFKDRESVVAISAAIEQGYKAVHIVSSGNAALSTAAYAQKAGLSCTCYVPEKTSIEKVALMKLFDATVHLIPGFYEDAYHHVVDIIDPVFKGKSWNVTTGQNHFRTEGNKTIAYELWQQLDGVPDVVVVGAGNGGCLAGIWQGFLDLKKLGKINKLPQMIAVQVGGAAPLKVAHELGIDYSILKEVKDSVAEGIVAAESYCSPKAIGALSESNGYVIEVDDTEIMNALQQMVALESIVPEPTTAAIYAALPKVSLSADATVVCIHGGTGLKLLDSITTMLKKEKR